MANIQKEINLNDEIITYLHKTNARSKTIRLIVRPDGDFVVSTPQKINEKIVQDFIIKNSEWVLEKIEYYKKNPKTIIPKHTTREIKEYKERAGVIARLRLEYFNEFYNLSWKNISIKNTKSRWGSCSSSGNLNFNYKIALLPTHLSDYVIVHELCHLEELNHSEKFWNLVAKTLPHHRELRRELKKII
jgi:predicted metal-dependent hydrolase